MMDDTSLLNGNLAVRIPLIIGLNRRSDIADGIELLNDHSSYIDENEDAIPLGYIIHDAFRTAKSGFTYLEDMRVGGKTRRNRKSARKTKRN